VRHATVAPRKKVILADVPKPPALAISDRAHAPVIYFEGVPFTGHIHGGFRLTLSLGLLGGSIGPVGQIENSQVIVAHLRGNKEALLSLKGAIEQALAHSGQKPEGKLN
jgi:hypothetical protein